MKICFVALEILGPFSGGGIATALAGQAEHHANKHDVTVLYVHPNLAAEDAAQWEAYYAERNVRFVRASLDTFYPQDTIPKRSFAVKQYLEGLGEDFDAIFFHDYLGLGYYTALSRRLGLGFHNTHLGTVIHGPSEWARTLNMVNEDAQNIALYEMERKQSEYSDFVVAPSQHILDWCTEQGWQLPENTRPISNILPERVDLHTGLSQGDIVQGIDELVFFGRLEIRKGFFTFLDAVKYLHKHKRTLPAKVTFLGAFCTNSDRNSASTVLEYAQDWECDVQFLNNYDHAQAIKYLVKNRPLTIVPSADESFGLTAYECLKFGVPTLFSNRGALATLPAAPERDDILFNPRPNELAEQIARALDDGVKIAAVDPVHLNAGDTWDALLDELAGTPPAPAEPWNALVTIDDPRPATTAPQSDPAPMVSVILVHHNRPSTLEAALRSLAAQTYKSLEVVLVDDGSRAVNFRAVEALVAQFTGLDITLVRQENRYLGAARNFGVQNAKGSYLLFMDDDNYALPTELEVLVKVAVTSGAEVLNTVSRLFRSAGAERMGYDLYLPIGPSLPLALFGNTFGDANSLVSRDLFERLGGFTEEYALGCEDYEFFNRAFVSGARMQFVPELLFDYRADDESMMNELNSGKYIINQSRGVTPLFDTHRQIDLAKLRGVMRVGFFTAVDEEYAYWIDQSIQRRQFADLEDKLNDLRYRPNSQAAAEIVVKLLSAYGRIREAVALMERNDITPDDQILRQMQTMLARHDRRGQNVGTHTNSVVNGAFEFWSLGTRHEGVNPYQIVANEWLIPSSKRRGTMVVSQEQDNALFGLTRSRTDKFMRIQTARPDPEGYCFLTQRIMDVGPLIESEVNVSMLVRDTHPGPLNAFLRVTYEHGTENYKDVWPEKQSWLNESWQMADMRFDLTPFSLDQTCDTSFVSLFVKLQTDDPMCFDLTDVVAVPHGERAQLAPYIRENERIRAERRLFSSGRGARFHPLGNKNLRVELPMEHTGKVGPHTRVTLRAPIVLALADGEYKEIECSEIVWRSTPDGPEGQGYLHAVVDREVGQVGTAMEDFMMISNYLPD